jgi:hypothetical protein
MYMIGFRVLLFNIKTSNLLFGQTCALDYYRKLKLGEFKFTAMAIVNTKKPAK